MSAWIRIRRVCSQLDDNDVCSILTPVIMPGVWDKSIELKGRHSFGGNLWISLD